jgi:BirA family biotin operon repressor/biotin-[acetyl-CoA-carboxylase] ligase
MEYTEIRVENAFGSPVLRVGETGSTMDDAREFERLGYPDGTALYADYQSAGRGRIAGRTWESSTRESLLCTVLLRRKPATGFTLRVGLAVSRALDRFLAGENRTAIKWPNDVLLDGKKLAGILCENTGNALLVGTGMNLAQAAFPEELGKRAISLALANGETERAPPSPEDALEAYLAELSRALADDGWAAAVSDRLWKRGERSRFIPGDPGKEAAVEGVVEGIGSQGELILRMPASGELRRFFSGEFPY